MTAVALDERVFEERFFEERSLDEKDPASKEKKTLRGDDEPVEDDGGFTELDVKWFEEGE